MGHLVCLVLGVMIFMWMPGVAAAQPEAKGIFDRISGHIKDGNWEFDWELKDDAGVELLNVDFKGERVIYKASVPVIRVKYVKDEPALQPFPLQREGCGPYQDRLTVDHLKDINKCEDNKVCRKSYTLGADHWVEIGVFAKIGEYRIYQAWYLNDKGYLGGKVWSHGLSCYTDHIHHPYWRIHFGDAKTQVFSYPDSSLYSKETEDAKSATKQYWVLQGNSSKRKIVVIPGTQDGKPDAFAGLDVALRRYEPAEDEPWPFGTGSLEYKRYAEDINNKDVVFWYVAHLLHVASEGPDQWKGVGPWLYVNPH
jgi:hypothetical protein